MTTSYKFYLTGFRAFVILALMLSAFGPWQTTQVFADKLVCAVPGKDGPTTTLAGVVNTYYPGRDNVTANATSIPVGAARGGGGPAIAAGDLLLVIQMQGEDIDSNNDQRYGSGIGTAGTVGNTVTYTTGEPQYAGGRLTTNFSAGQYEYVVAAGTVTGPVGGEVVPITSGLVNDYFNANFGTQGQRRFQVIRVPQYSSATLSNTVTALRWDGSTGGIVAFDVAGALNWNGNTVDVSGLGFRGGGGRQLAGGAGGNTDYRTLATVNTNGAKGEGSAGTPRYLNDNGVLLNTGVEGYPNGSNGRGSAGNAGGGSTDGNPAANDQNSGGGGGGNGGYGGMGGNSWNSAAVTGGFGGMPFPGLPSRLILGGGGGAGTTNNATGTPGAGFASSGAAGGGIVMVRSGTISGTGTINANGATANQTVGNDGGGGGGAGGNVIVIAANGGGSVGTLTVTAQGGNGGNTWATSAPGTPGPGTGNNHHGPGGGGGGGFVFTSGPVTGVSSVAGGINGTSTTDLSPFGATPGGPGTLVQNTTSVDIPLGISGAGCIPNPSVDKTTSTQTVIQTPTGTSGTYTIRVSVPSGQGTALGFTISDTLPTGFTYNSTSSINLSGGATQPTTVNPTDPAAPAWGTFDIPGGGQVQITFTVNIAASVLPGKYDNPAIATFTDPTRTVANSTTNTSYNYLSDPGEDITVVGGSLADLVVTKTNNVSGSVAPGSSFNWTINVSNSGGGTAAFTNGQTIVSDALPGLAGYYPQGALTVANGTTPPTETINCSISGTTLTCVANGAVTLTTSASFSITFAVTPTVAGDLINNAIVDPNGNVAEGNENNNTASNTVSVLGADLSILKDDAQTSYLAGSTVTYTVTVSNNSGVTVSGATVSDSRPANVSTWAWACTTQSGGATGCDPAVSSASNFNDTVNLPVGGTIVYTVTAVVVANPSGDLVNTGTVSVPSGYTDTNTNNNNSTDTDTLVTSGADLSIVKDDGQSGYSAGGTVTYTVTVTNLGGITVTGATVSDLKPANVLNWAWACTTQSGGATGCDAAASSSANFSDTVNLPVGGAIIYTVTANIVGIPSGNLVNTATISLPSGIADTNGSNNSSTDIDALNGADLSLTKTVNISNPAFGTTILFTLTVTNGGPQDATGVEVLDLLPSGFTYVSDIPSKGTYNSLTGLWAIGDLALNESATLTIIATVNLTGSYVNNAQISASLIIDPDSTPNNGVPTEDDQGAVTIAPAVSGGGDDSGRGGRGSGRRPEISPAIGGFLIPVTGFAPNRKTDLSGLPVATYDTKPGVTLEIPKLKLNLPIVGVPFKDGNWDVNWLTNQAGWLEQTAFPGLKGNSVLTGHVISSYGSDGPFAHLSNVEIGDMIFVHSFGQLYIYEIKSIKNVSPTDASVFKHEEKSWLTLVTCSNYDEKTEVYQSRLIVRSVLVETRSDFSSPGR